MPDSALCAYIDGIGILGPGLRDWPGTAAILRGESPYLPERTVVPASQLLPSAERRRTNTAVKLALAVGLQAIQSAAADAKALLTVFTSSGADGQNCHEICEALAGHEREVSPTRFHNSVHNAAAGYWGIATGAMRASNVLCAYDASFAAGLLDALTQVVIDHQSVLLVSYDSQYPSPLHEKRPILDAFGVALLLSPAKSAISIAHLGVELHTDNLATMTDPAFESMRAAIPAARALPLLQLLAKSERGCAVLPYLSPRQLRVMVEPCR